MMRKRIAAWALTACMALTLLPLHAAAAPLSGPTATETVLPTQVTAAAEEGAADAFEAAGLPVYTLQKMGNDRENLVLLLLGDGYTQDQQQQFLQEAREQLGRLMSLEPYSRLAHRINVYAVPAVSNEAGLSTEDTKLDTYFGLTTLFETKSIGFRSDTDGEARVNAIRADLEQRCLDEGAFVDNIHMFVNTDATVGSAHGIYSFSTGRAKDYAMAHELSHSVGKLGDEYGLDTKSPNVSTGSDIKWKKMMGYRSIIACENNDGRVLIPTAFKCNMYQSDQPFCEVCRLALVRRMFATGKIQNGMELYVADPEVTTEHKPHVDSEPYRVTQENLMEKAKDIYDLSLRTVIQNLSDQERKVKLVLGVVKADGEPREPLKEEVFTVPALTKNGNMEDACIYPTLTFNPIQGTNFEARDRLVGEVRDAKSGEVLATYQEPAYDTYQVDYLLEDGHPIPNTFPTQLLLPKGCSAEFIQEWLPQRVGGHDFVRMEREGLALCLYYRQTAQTVPPEKPKLEGTVTIIGTPKYNQPLTATVTNLTPAGAKLTYQWYHDDERILGAIKETYTPTAEDIGKSVHVAVSAEKCTGVLKSEEVTVAKADAFKIADYDCQMYYHITEVQEITAYNFVPADQVQDAVIKDGVRDMVDPDHIISTEDFTSTTFKLADGLTPADAGKTASWKVIITSTTHGDTTGTITVKITAKDAPVVPKPEPKPEPSQPGGGGSGGGGGGGSAGGGGSSSGKTETATKPDGTKVETVTKPDGTKVETATKPDGTTVKTETMKDGSSVTETKAADGSTGTVKTDKNGQTTAETEVSEKAVEDAKKNGEAVKAPVQVEATRDSNTAPVVKVELPRSSGDTKVEIPVSNVKPGTVAVLVHPDGTEEILKNSVPTEDGIQLTVDGNATVKIVDNAKDFIDTRDHWAKDAIDFVSARGLVSGMNDSTYAPDNATTRAQLWTILARQNDADLSGGNTWYENAQNWAKANGISDGTAPEGTINRAQMVTMLYRAAGSPEVEGASAFTDISADSYYAKAAAWAAKNGITAGVGNGQFEPNGTCTRGQIATFLYRYMK
ncbi:M64 family metallo-endopeptidase [Lawsonibacter sp. DFI.6.74]|nr:M64 family metallo-endopeptidase [Lawsonibacter sp. DFI.6.74]MCG4772477.1 M64 family metallo-endopeptidase [Lawsonibacter sp. DFI.5.51]